MTSYSKTICFTSINIAVNMCRKITKNISQNNTTFIRYTYYDIHTMFMGIYTWFYWEKYWSQQCVELNCEYIFRLNQKLSSWNIQRMLNNLVLHFLYFDSFARYHFLENSLNKESNKLEEIFTLIATKENVDRLANSNK